MVTGHRLIGRGSSKILVLPGWFGDESLLDPIEAHLDTAAFQYCVLAYRGTGASRKMVGTYTIDEIVHDALALADSLGWDRFAVMGHSMGGKVAHALARQAPARVRGIAAITPVPGGRSVFDAEGWALFSGAATALAKREAIIGFSTGQRLSKTFARRMAARSVARGQPEAFRAYLEAWANTDVRGDAPPSALPLLVVVGAHDPGLTEALMRETWLQDFSNGTIAVIADAGHYPIDEVPILLATTVEAFLSRLP